MSEQLPLSGNTWLSVSVASVFTCVTNPISNSCLVHVPVLEIFPPQLKTLSPHIRAAVTPSLSKHYIIDPRSLSIPTTTARVIAPAQKDLSLGPGVAHLLQPLSFAATCQPLRSPVWGYSSAKERAQSCAAMASFIPIISELLPMIMPASTYITTKEELEPVHATVDGPVIERPAVVGRCDKMCASGT